MPHLQSSHHEVMPQMQTTDNQEMAKRRPRQQLKVGQEYADSEPEARETQALVPGKR